MKKFKFSKISIIVLATVFILGVAGIIKAATFVNLDTADSFAILAGSGITNTGATTVTGNIGTFPTLTQTGFGTITLIGTNHVGNGVTQTAKTDLTTAYDDAAGQGSVVVASELGGTTKSPGVYNTADGELHVTGTLTLDGGGDPDAIFIFKAGSTLTTSSGATSHISLIGSAQACNVFWQVGSSATIGTGSDFKGNILAMDSITDDGGSTIIGRFLARNAAVTLNNTTITKATCAGAVDPILTLVKTITNDDGGTALITDWTLTADGTTPISGITGAGAVTNAVVTAGVYTLSETGGPTGYTASTYSCVKNGGAAVISNSITLANSDIATCTINNNDNVTHLIVIKNIVGGSNVASDYSTTITGVTTAVPTAAGAESPGVDNTITTFGVYTVDEGAHDGYEKTLSADCSSTIALGETKTCTITNTYIEPSHSSGGGTTYGCKDPSATNYNFFSSSKPELCVYTTTVITPVVTEVPMIDQVIIPKLPKTGFSPQTWYSFLLNSFLDLFR